MRWIGLLIALCVLAGCTAAVDGTGTAAPTASAGPSASAGSPATPGGVVLPPRPREVRVEGVDPCSLLSEQQRAELGLDGTPSLGTGPSILYDSDVTTCVVRGFTPRAIVVGVTVVTTAGIELFASGKLSARVSALNIQGFPAVLALPIPPRGYCTVVVDVAPGRLLEVHVSDGGREPPVPEDQLRRDAESAANAAMTTLLAR